MPRFEIQGLQRIYELLSRWDVDGFAKDVTHDFVLTLPETVPWGGKRHGRDGVEAFATIFRDHVDGQWAEADEFIDADDVIVVLGRLRGRGKATGEWFEEHFAHIWTLSDGVPSRCHSYFDTAPIMAALGLAR